MSHNNKILVYIYLSISTIKLVFADPPDWIDNYGEYEFTATIAAGLVLLDGEYFAEEEDIFAVFDNNGNVRGVAIQLNPFFGPYESQIIYEMQLRSNNEGDLLSFKYYDASEDMIFDILETYEFVINDILGDVINPTFYNIDIALIEEEIDCSEGMIFMENFANYEDICVPIDFANLNTSMQQKFYYFNTVTINGELIESADWVGAFYEGTCVGARLWDTSLCGSGICDLPVLGIDGYDATIGYIPPGEIPSFIIYDASNSIYYYTSSSEEITPFSNNSFQTITNLNGQCVDMEELVSPLGCASAVETLGCTGNWGDVPISKLCMDTCGLCEIQGCTDFSACNYNSDALNDDGSCEYYDQCDICGGDNACLTILNVDFPHAYSLIKNFPNPFNPITQIHYYIGKPSNISIIVYDIKGVFIEALYRDEQNPGQYEISWDASIYSTGVYLLEMTAFTKDGQQVFSEINKMIYLK